MAIRRIAVTGGPGAGKTTIWRELSRLHAGSVVAVPEVATLMFRHVFPPVADERERSSVQRAIFEVQKSLEEVYERRLGDGQVLLCDRGTPDGGGYWPDGHEAFFTAMGTRWDEELSRYDAVLFLETAAAGGLSIAAGNEVRTEDLATAVAVDQRLRDVWSRHPAFRFVRHERELADKVTRGLEALASLITLSS